MSESNGALPGSFQKNASSPRADGELRSAFSVGEAEVKEDRPFCRRHKRPLVCGGLCIGFLVILGIIALSLALTVFKTKQPVIHVDSITLKDLSIDGNLTSLSATSVNMTLGVQVSVYNPNQASFKYTNGTSYMYYRDTQVGEAPIPAGKIGAKGTETLSTVLTLNASQVLTNPNLIPDYMSGSFPITTSAEVSGRVNFLNVFKHHAKSISFCNISVSVNTRSIQNLTCRHHLKI